MIAAREEAQRLSQALANAEGGIVTMGRSVADAAEQARILKGRMQGLPRRSPGIPPVMASVTKEQEASANAANAEMNARAGIVQTERESWPAADRSEIRGRQPSVCRGRICGAGGSPAGATAVPERDKRTDRSGRPTNWEACSLQYISLKPRAVRPQPRRAHRSDEAFGLVIDQVWNFDHALGSLLGRLGGVASAIARMSATGAAVEGAMLVGGAVGTVLQSVSTTGLNAVSNGFASVADSFTSVWEASKRGHPQPCRQHCACERRGGRRVQRRRRDKPRRKADRKKTIRP